MPFLYSCDNCTDSEGVPDALDATCSESPISTCKRYEVEGEFRIGVYDYAGTRPNVIYGKGSCPVVGAAHVVELATALPSSTVSLSSKSSIVAIVVFVLVGLFVISLVLLRKRKEAINKDIELAAYN